MADRNYVLLAALLGGRYTRSGCFTRKGDWPIEKPANSQN